MSDGMGTAEPIGDLEREYRDMLAREQAMLDLRNGTAVAVLLTTLEEL